MLADDCNYGPVKEELIRDRIVVGVLDDTLSLELQARGQLTLSEAITLSRQSEERKQNQTLIRKQSTVNAVRHSKQNNLVQNKQRARMPLQKHCGYCGKEIHSRTQCPANYAICNNCNKKGQYQSICRQSCNCHGSAAKPNNLSQKCVNELSEHLKEEAEYLGHIYILNDKDCWTEKIFENNRPIHFKSDTDAAVSVIR